MASKWLLLRYEKDYESVTLKNVTLLCNNIFQSNSNSFSIQVFRILLKCAVLCLYSLYRVFFIYLFIAF